MGIDKLKPEYKKGDLKLVIPTGIKGAREIEKAHALYLAARSPGRSCIKLLNKQIMEENKEIKIVEDDSLIDKITDKVKEVASKECRYVKNQGKHRYLKTEERDKVTLSIIFRCVGCGRKLIS
jgi:hypothetical protein